MRSFQYIQDLVDGLIALMKSSDTRPVNLGNGDEFTILEFAELVQRADGVLAPGTCGTSAGRSSDIQSPFVDFCYMQ